MSNYPSWGFYPPVKHQDFISIENRYSTIPQTENSVLPRGLGRSYGDSCLNEYGTLLGSEKLNHFISFDVKTGILRCEAGVTFAEILQVFVPKGWFLPVTPGTKFITVGGAIANDVHGKNHHVAGNFGHHVTQFELLRSTGERFLCSKEENADLFYATIGGLGLTGFITWAEFKMTPIESAFVHQEQIQFQSLKEFFELSEQSESSWEYTVAWVDCVNTAKDIRGIFMRGNFGFFNNHGSLETHKTKSLKTVPCFLPNKTLNKFFVKAFNQLYYRKNLKSFKKNTVHYDSFFYPLDAIHNWNRIYGKDGFLQYQCVVPYKHDNGAALKEIFQLLQKSELGSFLAVLKTFGTKKSEGLMSFPQEGVTLALDFPNHGEQLRQVLSECDKIVRKAQGSVYPAKDARMSKEDFAAFYPNLTAFEQYIDPKFSSSFWRRVR